MDPLALSPSAVAGHQSKSASEAMHVCFREGGAEPSMRTLYQKAF